MHIRYERESMAKPQEKIDYSVLCEMSVVRVISHRITSVTRQPR